MKKGYTITLVLVSIIACIFLLLTKQYPYLLLFAVIFYVLIRTYTMDYSKNLVFKYNKLDESHAYYFLKLPDLKKKVLNNEEMFIIFALVSDDVSQEVVPKVDKLAKKLSSQFYYVDAAQVKNLIFLNHTLKERINQLPCILYFNNNKLEMFTPTKLDSHNKEFYKELETFIKSK